MAADTLAPCQIISSHEIDPVHAGYSIAGMAKITLI